MEDQCNLSNCVNRGGIEMHAGQLRAGVAEVPLQPPLGLATGDGAPVAKGYGTPLHAKAIVLSNGENEVSLVTLDAMGIARDDVLRVTKQIEQRCGIPAEALMVACSHTHVAPSMEKSLHTYRRAFHPNWDEVAIARETAWVEQVLEGIATAVCQAKSKMQVASIGVVSSELPWLVFNRRRHTRN
jgi:neutral ceramidase